MIYPKPTGELRWVYRSGEKILQQRVRKTRKITRLGYGDMPYDDAEAYFEWQDVPVEEE